MCYVLCTGIIASLTFYLLYSDMCLENLYHVIQLFFIQATLRSIHGISDLDVGDSDNDHDGMEMSGDLVLIFL